MTYLCVPIFVTELARARRDIATAVEAGAEMIELRIDRLPHAELISTLLREMRLPVIVTCRPTWEGGHSEQDDAARSLLLTMAAEDGASYIDLELKTAEEHESKLIDVLENKPADVNARLILSSHDFTGRPDRLYNIVQSLNRLPGEINKIVWLARTIRDNLEAFELLQHKSKPTIALCMGEAGVISRVLAKKFGSFLTFAALDSTSGTAPGQVTIGDMKKLYRWDAIGPQTKVFGVVAQPVLHSMSPAIHNAAFDAIGYDGVYLPMLVEGSYESFKAFMESFIHFRGLDLAGLSITIPHKENALRYLQHKGAKIEDLAARIGAVNTIAIDRENGKPKLRGFNTDYAAILACITSKLAIDNGGLKDLRFAVLGAGGTGRTAVAALAHWGAHVKIYNRTKDRADALASEFDGYLRLAGAKAAGESSPAEDVRKFAGNPARVIAMPMESLDQLEADVIINTTSIGMHPHVEASPLGDHVDRIKSGMLVFDAIYNPLKTKLLEQAEAAGAKTIAGIEMFVRQAAAQFETWTGAAAPTQVMRGVITDRLGKG
jgi:3-dehydroquinate dehydratase/shikimate dehydrogenase